MITVSILNWEYIYWIDLSEQWAEIIEIKEEDFISIQSNNAEMIDWKVIYNKVKVVKDWVKFISNKKKW